ncbi:hypothetical protein SCB71_19755 [Herbiconiux sp. KACC 21604]|uniref:hypothetical protein n=1 Tax=unclassified Herbiconiux TaxID=2618217 RepID=UPI0014921889|nr:hypothetical protein [Herbiconiux sp. SALV-R1]QJU55265.1 hypothetical protein HL652_17685 [Herbiconiux sp. SALV-R1]WPO86432.1 hypothetical protein SCB71_19755 [Herbiconiux sp. KACC 21604]
MDTLWIILLAVAAIIVVLAVAIALVRRRSGDRGPLRDERDTPVDTQYDRTTTAARFADRTGWGAGGGSV